MNILTQTMPCGVYLDGKFYKMNTDFRVWLHAMDIFEKYDMRTAALLLTPLCYRDIPENEQLALSGLIYFLNLGEKSENTGSGKKIISFAQDASLIYCAFLSQYGIDLNVCDMHYWKFFTLLCGLCGEHTLLKVISIRNADLSGISNSEARRELLRLKNIHRINRGEYVNPADTLFGMMNGDDIHGKQ